jgi:hypothetical protein
LENRLDGAQPGRPARRRWAFIPKETQLFQWFNCRSLASYPIAAENSKDQVSRSRAGNTDFVVISGANLICCVWNYRQKMDQLRPKIVRKQWLKLFFGSPRRAL